MKKILFPLIIMTGMAFGSDVFAANPKPFVVPELRQWKGTDGNFTTSPSTRIVVASPDLKSVADSLSSDWARMFGSRLEVVSGKPSKGDIVLSLKADKGLGKEGYSIDITDRVSVTAPERIGVYWATRTILQMAEQSDDHSFPKGKITDWPDYGLRGLSMDVGRKFFPMSYLKDLVKVLSYYKYNSLRIHLNDNGFPAYFENDWDKTYAAFRMESDRFPGLTARDGYYTKDEFRNFQLSSAGDFVDIVPEIDIPAHALAFARYKKGIGSKDFGQDHLDLFNPETQPFMDAVFDEYLGGDNPVFINEYVHIGTDEFGKDFPGFDKQKETAEKFRGMMDHYIRLIESYGKKPWVWGSLSTAPGETPIKTEGVMLDAWYNGYADPKEMVKLGFKINSIPDGMVYIVPAASYYHDYLNNEWLYTNWTPAKVGNVQFEEKDPALAGGYFAVWNDHVGNGISVQDVHHRIMAAIPTMAAKLWDGPSVTVPFEDFSRESKLLSEAPGLNLLGRYGEPGDVVFEAAKLNPGKKTPIKDLGYGYTVEFDWDAVAEEPGTVLFKSPNSTVYLSDPVSGMLGFSRDGYLNKFSFRPYPGEKVHVRIDGDNLETKLYINGELYETLNKQTQIHKDKRGDELVDRKMYYIRTLMFPLEEAGDFKSKITNFKAYNSTTTE